MSIRVDMTSSDLDRQIALLKFYPEVMEKHFKAVLQKDTKALHSQIKPNIPRSTGRAQRMFRSKVTGRGVNLQGAVGWFGKSAPWYINVVEHGAKAHDINSYVPRLGKIIKKHPGFSKRGFMAAGYSAMKPVIEADMQKASEAVLKEMEIK